MKRLLFLAPLLLLAACGGSARNASDTAELTRLLNEFLAGASRDDAATHERFWAEELIYTASAGRRIGKADILKEVQAGGAETTGAPVTVYTAEEIQVRPYGDTAVVAFRLLGTTTKDGQTRVARYLNTGTFRRENGQWRAVAWQATRMPRPAEEAREEVAAAETAFHEALRGSDAARISAQTDESFIWTDDSGEQVTRERLVEELGSGRMKFSMLETAHVLVSVHADAAVVRGIALRRRAAAPGAAADRAPMTVYFTLTYINKDGDWKAVALHTSRV